VSEPTSASFGFRLRPAPLCAGLLIACLRLITRADSRDSAQVAVAVAVAVTVDSYSPDLRQRDVTETTSYARLVQPAVIVLYALSQFCRRSRLYPPPCQSNREYLLQDSCRSRRACFCQAQQPRKGLTPDDCKCWPEPAHVSLAVLCCVVLCRASRGGPYQSP